MSDHDDVQGPATVADVQRLQEQLNDLTATLEAHQRLFEQLRAAGVLPPRDQAGA